MTLWYTIVIILSFIKLYYLLTHFNYDFYIFSYYFYTYIYTFYILYDMLYIIQKLDYILFVYMLETIIFTLNNNIKYLYFRYSQFL